MNVNNNIIFHQFVHENYLNIILPFLLIIFQQLFFHHLAHLIIIK